MKIGRNSFATNSNSVRMSEEIGVVVKERIVPDTLRSSFPDKYCAWCGKKGECYFKHWGPLMRGKIVYLDDCIVELRSVSSEGVEPRFDSFTGEAFIPNSNISRKAE